MGGEKEEWRPELGCKALEPVLLRRRPRLVIHGHIHKGIAAAELRPTRNRLDDFADAAEPVPVHNVAYPVRRAISTFDPERPARVYRRAAPWLHAPWRGSQKASR